MTRPGLPPRSKLLTTAQAALLAAVLACSGASLAREGVEVGKESGFTRLVPAGQVEQSANNEYRQLLEQARAKHALAPDNHPQVIRLRAIAQRLIPQALAWNPRAQNWQWEVNLLASKQINAFCMPGGKIAVYTGILEQLKLNDDEVAMVMGHEIAHALREHARERMGKTAATSGLIDLGSSLLGLGSTGRMIAGFGGQLLTLKFSRENETEADLVGMELAARAGYDPRAGVSLWRKMSAANHGAPPQWMSTHPAGDTRIREIETNLDKVLPLYERAEKPPRRFDGLTAPAYPPIPRASGQHG